MTKETLAEMLNGRQYRNEISKSEASLAKQHGLVVVMGASDDLLEFSGIIAEELGACNGCDAHIFRGGDGKWVAMTEEQLIEITDELKDKNIPFSLKSYPVTAVWSPEEPECSWLVKTDLPHTTFDILEDEELYCRGLVIDLKEL